MNWPREMNSLFIVAIVLNWIVVVGCCWLGWQLLRQNGRILLRLDDLEKRLDEWEFDEPDQASNGEPTSDRAGGFNNRSLVRSKIKRDGLEAGTLAPDFRLPRLDGQGELSLQELRGRRVLLVFSDPHCGPCNHLAPQLERFHREQPDIQIVMISRGDPKENRAKVREQSLTFPIILQQQWEISRRYAMFATPVGYVIDESGIIVKDVAVGVEPILALFHEQPKSFHDQQALS